MTVTARPEPGLAPVARVVVGTGGGLGAQLMALSHRSVTRTLRQPALIAPALLIPLFLLASTAGGLAEATSLPGFPPGSYLSFALAVVFLNGALFAVSGAGSAAVRDITTGFLSRLALTPVRRGVLLTGMLAGPAVLGLLQACLFLAIGLVTGAHVVTGPLGALTVIGLSVLMTVMFGALGLLVALRSGSGEVVQAVFPLLLVLSFLSSQNLPRPLISIDWFRAVATFNPMSYLIEAPRSLLITGWDLPALALGTAICGGTLLVALVAGSALLRNRLATT